VAAPETENTRVTVFEAGLRKRGPVLQFDIEGNRFLRKMVRAITGALVEVGRGRLDTDFFTRVLSGDEGVGTFAVAPACGLYLVSVTYDDGPPGP
jgi:tRNA pseudouridine38-40 synthase